VTVIPGVLPAAKVHILISARSVAALVVARAVAVAESDAERGPRRWSDVSPRGSAAEANTADRTGARFDRHSARAAPRGVGSASVRARLTETSGPRRTQQRPHVMGSDNRPHPPARPRDRVERAGSVRHGLARGHCISVDPLWEAMSGARLSAISKAGAVIPLAACSSEIGG
jgi:hypothetical protein